MATQPRPHLTPQQYLDIDRSAQLRSEYYDGEMFPMTAVSLTHDGIFSNVYQSLGTQLKGQPCRRAGSNLRIRPAPGGPYFYPDILIFCGAPVLEDRNEDTLLDVTAIIEILSPSTERYDRTFKFEHYRKLPSFQHYLLVAQNEVKVEHRIRQENRLWAAIETSDPQAVVELSAIACRLLVADIYENVGLQGVSR